MKIKEQTRRLSTTSKQCFEVVDRTDEVSNHTYGKAKLTWFEEIFEEYDKEKTNETRFLSRKLDLIRQNDITKSGLSIH